MMLKNSAGCTRVARKFAALGSSLLIEIIFQAMAMTLKMTMAMAMIILGRLPAFATNSLARQITGRTHGADSIEGLPRCRPESRGDLLFFCSSAGEFEQARPVIDRLSESLGLEPMILFLSRSGLEYIRARGEKIRAALAPPDTLWRWRRFDSRHKICASVVIRHEWWPSFLNIFGGNRPMLLIDAGRPAGSPNSKLKNLGRGYLARQFTQICTVDEASRTFFTKHFAIDPAKIMATGDTKYDRVMDRAVKTVVGDDLRRQISTFAKGRKILVAGSIYAADIALLMKSWRDHPELATSWAIVAVPHYPDQATAQSLLKQIGGAGCDLLIVSRMGVLAELYSLADAAWVGGACHNKIHNSLEPAAHGVNLGSGMKFSNSPEAVQMHREGVLHALAGADSVAQWLKTLELPAASPPGERPPASLAFVTARTGAAQKICDLLEAKLNA